MRSLFVQSQPIDKDALRQRIVWLCGIRRYAALGMIMAALIGRYLFGIQIPLHYLALLAIVTIAYNVYYTREAQKEDFNPAIAFEQILFDVVVLTLTLLLTGGFLNPFFTFYFFAIILAWIVLPPNESVVITILVTVGFSMQNFASHFSDVDMRLSNQGLLHMGDLPFHVVGAPISFIITTALTAYFVYVIMTDLRKREQEVRLARQQAELELNKLDNILRQIEAGMIVFDRNNRMEWVNDRIQNWFGQEGLQEDCACYRICQFVKTLSQTNVRSFANGQHPVHHFEMAFPTRTQGILDFEIVVTPVCDAYGERMQVIEMILDVTEQKKKQDQWVHAQKLAAIGQLAAGLAHEINTPLGTISILAQETRELLAEESNVQQSPNQEDMDRSLATIYEQTRRCKEITQSLLNVSRRNESTREWCHVNDLVRRAVELTRPRAPRIRFVEELDEHLPTTITCTGDIERSLFNLLINAADALEQQPHSPAISIRTFQKNGMILIEVADNGPGIDKEVMPHIFEPFFTTKTVGKGTGLGLYVSYNAIHDLGGELIIESQPHEGTKATLVLPIHHE